jgi:chorismate mutase / prephenate dehydratase
LAEKRSMSANPPGLAEFRRRIDEIDDRLHDLIIERAAVVTQIAATKAGTDAGYYQPGREAEILRRLADRHYGVLPVGSVLRIWRELLAATVRLETPFAVAVFEPAEMPGFWDLARDHYGSHAPISAYRSTVQVIRAVAEGQAEVGVLPMPQQSEPDPWWRHLMSHDNTAPRVVVRLPFAGRGNARGRGVEALVIGHVAAAATGADRTLFAAESTADISHARLVALLSTAGLDWTFLASWQHAEATLNLVEVDGFVTIGDPRIASVRAGLLSRLVPVGSYAMPLPPAKLVAAKG